MPLDGEIRALTKQTGTYGFAVGVARRHDRRLHRLRRPDDRPAERQGRRDPRHRRRPPLDLRAASTARSLTTAGTRPAGVARRRHAARHRRGPRRHPPLPGRRSTARAPEPVTHGRICVQSFDARAGRIVTAQATVERPGRDRHPRRAGHRASRRSLPRVGEVRRADDRRHGRDRRLDHAPGGLRGPPQATRCCSTSTAARSPSTARRSSTRPRCRPPPASSSLMSQPTRRQRARHGMGPGDQRPQAPDGARHRVGQRRRRRRAGRARRRPRPLPVLRPRPRRHARRQLRRLHGDAARRPPRRPLPGDLLRAGRQQPDVGGVEQRHRQRVPRRRTGRRTSTTPTSTRACRRSATSATSTCRC